MAEKKVKSLVEYFSIHGEYILWDDYEDDLNFLLRP